MTEFRNARRVVLLAAFALSAACSSGNEAAPGAGGDADAAVEVAVPEDAAVDNVAVEDAMLADAVADAPTCTPLNPAPGDGPGGYRLDGWTWTRHGVVLEDSSADAQSGYIAPAALVLGDTIHLWVTRKQGLVHRILHAVSVDGLTFSEPVPTTGIEGQDIIAYPSVVYDGARFLMWYGSGSIDLAQSEDGVTWTMISTGVLKPGGAGSFDSLSLLYPNVVASSDGYVMYYTGYDGQAFGIGRAESVDGTSWIRSPAGAVLAHGGASEFDNHAAAQPCAVSVGSRVLLWYGGYDTSVANPGPYRVGLAESDDGLAFVRKGVTLDLAPAGVEAWSTRDPSIVRWMGKWWMAYAVMGDDARYRIAVASSDTCGKD